MKRIMTFLPLIIVFTWLVSPAYARDAARDLRRMVSASVFEMGSLAIHFTLLGMALHMPKNLWNGVYSM